MSSFRTALPNKGGIDQSPAGWRLVHVDAKGEVTSEKRASGVEGSLELAAAARSRLAVNAYRSAGRTLGVDYVVSRNGQELARGSMRRRTDWAWEANESNLPKDAKVALTARFADGSVRTVTNDVADERLVASVNVGGNLFWCPPIASGDIVYAGIDDEGGTGNSGVVAYAADLSRELWRFKSVNVVRNAIACTAEYLSAPMSIVSVAPVMAGGEIWFGASDGVVRAVDPATGKVVYRHALGAPVLSAAAVGKGLVYVADYGGNLTAFKQKS